MHVCGLCRVEVKRWVKAQRAFRLEVVDLEVGSVAWAGGTTCQPVPDVSAVEYAEFPDRTRYTFGRVKKRRNEAHVRRGDGGVAGRSTCAISLRSRKDV